MNLILPWDLEVLYPWSSSTGLTVLTPCPHTSVRRLPCHVDRSLYDAQGNPRKTNVKIMREGDREVKGGMRGNYETESDQSFTSWPLSYWKKRRRNLTIFTIVYIKHLVNYLTFVLLCCPLTERPGLYRFVRILFLRLSFGFHLVRTLVFGPTRRQFFDRFGFWMSLLMVSS